MEAIKIKLILYSAWASERDDPRIASPENLSHSNTRTYFQLFLINLMGIKEPKVIKRQKRNYWWILFSNSRHRHSIGSNLFPCPQPSSKIFLLLMFSIQQIHDEYSKLDDSFQCLWWSSWEHPGWDGVSQNATPESFRQTLDLLWRVEVIFYLNLGSWEKSTTATIGNSAAADKRNRNI